MTSEGLIFGPLRCTQYRMSVWLASSLSDIQTAALQCGGRRERDVVRFHLRSPPRVITLMNNNQLFAAGCKSFVQCVDAFEQVRQALSLKFPADEFKIVKVKVNGLSAESELPSGAWIDMDDLETRVSKDIAWRRRECTDSIFLRPHNSSVMAHVSGERSVITYHGGRSESDMLEGAMIANSIIAQSVRQGGTAREVPALMCI